MTFPLDSLIAKLKAGQNACWLGIGDSTYAGVGDTTYSGGWPTRFGKLIGQYVGCVVRRQFSITGSDIIYNPPTSTGATLLLTSVGGPGTTFANDLSYINGGAFTSPNLASTAPDAVAIWGGINDLSFGGITSSTIGPSVKTIVDRIRSDFGSNPKIIIGNQSPTLGLAYNSGYAGLFNYFSSQSTLPLNPALVSGTSAYPNLWCLDSHQAFGVLGTSDTLGFAKWMSDGLHPNLAGYTIMAQWMFDLLVNPPVTGSAPTITTSQLNTISFGVSFSQTLAASGSTPLQWSIQSGSLPTGLILNSASGVISGTPTSNGSYDVTVQATNSYGTTSQRLTGSVQFFPTFNPSGTATTKYKTGNLYYPAKVQVRVDGSFRSQITRD